MILLVEPSAIDVAGKKSILDRQNEVAKAVQDACSLLPFIVVSLDKCRNDYAVLVEACITWNHEALFHGFVGLSAKIACVFRNRLGR